MSENGERFQAISGRYQDAAIAQEYDAARFTSISGRVFNCLEKKCLLGLLKRLKGRIKINKALDIPCGTGRITEIIAGEVPAVVAADVSEQMIDVAKEKLYRFKNIDYRVADIKRTPFDDNAFDCVTSIRFFHHLDREDRLDALKELARIANHYVIINISHASGWHRIRRRLKTALGQGLARVAISDPELREDLKKSGLEEMERRYMLPVISENVLLTLKKIRSL